MSEWNGEGLTQPTYFWWTHIKNALPFCYSEVSSFKFHFFQFPLLSNFSGFFVLLWTFSNLPLTSCQGVFPTFFRLKQFISERPQKSMNSPNFPFPKLREICYIYIYVVYVVIYRYVVCCMLYSYRYVV